MLAFVLLMSFQHVSLILTINYNEQKPIATKVSSMFGGTRDKCFGCKNTVYPTEKVKELKRASIFNYFQYGNKDRNTIFNMQTMGLGHQPFALIIFYVKRSQ